MACHSQTELPTLFTCAALVIVAVLVAFGLPLPPWYIFLPLFMILTTVAFISIVLLVGSIALRRENSERSRPRPGPYNDPQQERARRSDRNGKS